MDATVKQEQLDNLETFRLIKGSEATTSAKSPAAVIELSSSSSSSSSSSDSDSDDGGIGDSGGVRVSSDSRKKRKLDDLGVVMPVGFLAPLPHSALPGAAQSKGNENTSSDRRNKQFWKAGDYEGSASGDWDISSAGMDHVRVHPKFLHSNATSHKWALGAFAELLDNALDEVCNGATYVNIDMLKSRKDGSRMLLIEDNGGGMDPDKMRQCMSLGYSAKSKVANTIGQYGNGFKTSTMRLGADVLVFSRCRGKDGKSPTQTIGLLSYTFLTNTGKEDIVVPMLDYERKGNEWNKMTRFSSADWNRNVETIVQWSPFSSEAELLRQFTPMSDHGTRIIIYNLWEDDQGLLELDFDTDPNDIQLRGVNRDEKNIQMAKEFPNSRHFLTYRHSLRSYASILYLRIPPGFRIILRGKDVDHHNIVNDMMLSQEITYRPQGADGLPKDSNMTAVVTIGFVKDAKHHIDVQGFNVYHKNRLIKPFWRLWNAAGSDGRGVIGVLEANFVEPAHDKQGFERTTVLARLESRLVQMQKTYWSTKCHKIGYAPRRNKRAVDDEFTNRGSPSDDEEYSPVHPTRNAASGSKGAKNSDKFYTPVSLSGRKVPKKSVRNGNFGHESAKGTEKNKTTSKSGRKTVSSESSPAPSLDDVSDDDVHISAQESMARSQPTEGASGSNQRVISESYIRTIDQLKDENLTLKKRLELMEANTQGDIMQDRNCEKCKSLELQLQEAQNKIDELNQEQESLINIFSEERERRDEEEENSRKKFKEASNTIQQLLEKVKILEKMKTPSYNTLRR